jgi:hypothetical protein
VQIETPARNSAHILLWQSLASLQDPPGSQAGHTPPPQSISDSRSP